MMHTMTHLPIVLVPACNRQLGDHPFHIAGRKYVEAVRLSGALPLVVPRAEPGELSQLLDIADGIHMLRKAHRPAENDLFLVAKDPGDLFHF